MKVYISADIEGVTGVTAWDETEKDKGDYPPFAKQMTLEVAACCRGALAGGAKEIYVKDSHSSGRNIIPSLLPEEAILIRGWTRDPDMMVGGLDESFDALLFTGYHSGCGLEGNPLSHTMNGLPQMIRIDGRMIGEFEMHAIIASGYGVKPVFLSGDRMQCLRAEEFVKGIVTAPVKEGVGMATFNPHPDRAIRLIEEKSREALENRDAIEFTTTPPYVIEITFRHHYQAYRMSHFPGARQINDTAIAFKAESQRDLAVFFMFVL